MSTMDWDAFHDSHHRPHLVRIDLPPVSEPLRGARFEILKRLVEQLGPLRPYAMQSERTGILAAFESDLDAKRFGDLLAAKPGPGDAAWASTARCSFDRSDQRKISRALREARLKLARNRPMR
jgi:hypothetical protein